MTDQLGSSSGPARWTTSSRSCPSSWCPVGSGAAGKRAPASARSSRSPRWVASLALVPLGRLDVRRALVTGIGLDARLTTEIVVAQLLYSSGLIDLGLFTALVAASSVSSTSIPVIFSLLLGRWRQRLTDDVAERPGR